MNTGLIAIGIAVIAITFIGLNFVIDAQQRNSIGLSSEFCGSVFGQIGGALSPGYAEECRTKQVQAQLLSIESLLYLAGAVIIIAGIALPPTETVHIVRETRR
ncbi:hypothetical protein EPN87_04030 [archaeon]|nr:MAG: hypothetical protein EPN87_04030 [archaeon]